MLSCAWKHCCTNVQQRWIFAVMGCMAIANAYAMRICLSLAITEMVIATNLSSNDTNSYETCSVPISTSSFSRKNGTYDWDEYTQGIILSSFFGGYIITHLPGGLLADKFGGKHTLGLGILSTAIFTLLTPVVIEVYDWIGLIVLRFLMGLGEGTTFPAASMLVAQWAPPDERTKIGTVVTSGIQVGTIAGTALSGVLINYSSMGWPIVFYFFGSLSVLWFFFWVLLCYNNPEVHPFISENEKKYLRDTMNKHTHRKAHSTPWRHMLTSIPLWTLLAANFCHGWGFYTMVTDLPLYMKKILKFSIQENGFLSAIPYVLMWIVGVTSSWLADWSVSSGKLSRTNMRKACTTVATVGPALFIIAASYAGCDRTLVVILFNVGMALMGTFQSGLLLNAIDLSPNHAGTIMALLNGLGAISGIAAPYVIGVLTPNQTLSEWRIAFWIAFVLFLLSALIFDIWADGEVQYWNDSEIRVHQNEGKKQAKEDVTLSRS